MQPPIVDGLTETPSSTSGLLAMLTQAQMKKSGRRRPQGERREPPSMMNDPGQMKIGPMAGPSVKTPI